MCNVLPEPEFRRVLALQTIDGPDNAGLLEHLDQPVKKALVVVRSGFEIFFNNALSGAHGLKR